MDKIHLVMPMAGGGTRFSECGFAMPKPLIELNGKPFFYWAVESVNNYIEVWDITFVVLKDHVSSFGIDRVIKDYYPRANVRVIPNVLNGAVMTCREAVKEIDDDLPILFNDCDHAFLANSFYEYAGRADFKQVDGALLTFKSNSPNYSYVIVDEQGNVTGTIEKEVASDEAICGAYYFRNKAVFAEAAETYLERCSYKELFMSGLYNELVFMGSCVATFPLDLHISFGTPEEYERIKQDSRLNMINGTHS